MTSPDARINLRCRADRKAAYEAAAAEEGLDLTGFMLAAAEARLTGAKVLEEALAKATAPAPVSSSGRREVRPDPKPSSTKRERR